MYESFDDRDPRQALRDDIQKVVTLFAPVQFDNSPTPQLDPALITLYQTLAAYLPRIDQLTDEEVDTAQTQCQHAWGQFWTSGKLMGNTLHDSMQPRPPSPNR